MGKGDFASNFFQNHRIADFKGMQSGVANKMKKRKKFGGNYLDPSIR